MDEFFAHRATPRWGRRGTSHELRREVSRHGVCAVDLGSESLRDIEVTLGANAGKLYSMGLRHSVHRSTVADANDSRDWRIGSDLAALLIRRARKLYREEDLGLDLTNTVYALDATTIDLCLSLFDWAPFRSTKAAVKMHTLLDLRGSIPAFIHISDGKMGDVNVLDFLPVEAGPST